MSERVYDAGWPKTLSEAATAVVTKGSDLSPQEKVVKLADAERMRKQIAADHRYKAASVGGSPCVCIYCQAES